MTQSPFNFHSVLVSAGRIRLPEPPGLLQLILSRKILREEHWKTLIVDSDPDEYQSIFWLEKTTAHFQFVMVSRLLIPPEWCAEGFFVMRVSS